ncbi:MAG: hypothetical protein QOF40_1332 [Actinomycetota bacterium]|nr:hypothetical protein [Actinomycetota bacterium]
MALAPRTIAAYRADWSDFLRWCDAHAVSAIPAADDVVVAYVEDLAATLRASTVQRRVASIRNAHADAGFTAATDTSAIGAALARARWYRRDSTTETTPIAVDELRAMSISLPDSIAGVRDRALLLIGYGAALRPSEIVHLDVGDLTIMRDALGVATERGRVLVPYGSADELCAVTAWMRWVARTGIAEGPAFRAVERRGQLGRSAFGEKAVGRIIRRAALAAGLDPTRYTGLSLRRGMIATAGAHGASREAIMRQTGHRSERLVRRYLLAAESLRDTRRPPPEGETADHHSC